jgi:hypothetical protein
LDCFAALAMTKLRFATDAKIFRCDRRSRRASESLGTDSRDLRGVKPVNAPAEPPGA